MEDNDDCVVIGEVICKKSTTDIALLPSTEDISRALECPICLQIPFGPIVLCSSGHSFCRDCSNSVKKCPVCEASYVDVRCLALESIISMLKFDCPYKTEGCKEVLPSGGRFKMHKDSCDYRPITCNESKGRKCSDKEVPFSEYITHLQKDHFAPTIPVNAIITQSIIPPIRSLREFSYNCFFVDNLTFLENCRITDNSIYWWICVHSTKWTAEQYMASVLLGRVLTPTSPTAQQGQNEKIKWTVPVLSTRDCVNENGPEVAAYPLKDLLKLSDLTVGVTGKKKYTWQLQIAIQKNQKRVNTSTLIPEIDITGDPIITPPKPRRLSKRRRIKNTNYN